MPFINVKTNVKVTNEKKEAIKSAFGEAITLIPGKSETWLMVGIEPEYDLYFKGTDEPAAMVEVGIYGSANSAALNNLTAEICDIINGELNIPTARIYVMYTQTPDWGWNRMNL